MSAPTFWPLKYDLVILKIEEPFYFFIYIFFIFIFDCQNWNKWRPGTGKLWKMCLIKNNDINNYFISFSEWSNHCKCLPWCVVHRPIVRFSSVLDRWRWPGCHPMVSAGWLAGGGTGDNCWTFPVWHSRRETCQKNFLIEI